MWSRLATVLASPPVLAEIPRGLDFAATAAALGRPRPAAYVGYSLGGRLALQLAVDYPDRVTALGLVSSSPGIADVSERAQRKIRDERLAAWIESNGREAFLDRWLSQPMFENLDPDRARAHRLESAAEIADQLRRLSPGAQKPLWDRLRELQQPVLIVAGQRDPQYTAIAADMARRIGDNAEVHMVPATGHAIPMERPEAIATLLAGWP